MRHLVLSLLALLSSSAAFGADDLGWPGTYVFCESGMNATGTRSYIIAHYLDVASKDGKLIATYHVEYNGDPLSIAERWLARVEGDALVFTYDRCVREPKGECEDQYKRGEKLLKLVRAKKNSKPVLKSYWYSFKPDNPKLKSGGIHFEREREK